MWTKLSDKYKARQKCFQVGTNYEWKCFCVVNTQTNMSSCSRCTGWRRWRPGWWEPQGWSWEGEKLTAQSSQKAVTGWRNEWGFRQGWHQHWWQCVLVKKQHRFLLSFLLALHSNPWSCRQRRSVWRHARNFTWRHKRPVVKISQNNFFTVQRSTRP